MNGEAFPLPPSSGDPIAVMLLPFLSLPLGQIIPWLIQYRYWILFPIMVFEGPVITIIAGFLVSLGYLDFIATYVLAVTADLIGDSLYYVAGRFGTDRFLERRSRRIKTMLDRVETVKEHFERHVGKTLVVGKLTHGAGGLILFAAGVFEIRFATFLLYNALGTLPKSLALLLVGYYFGHSYQRISSYLNDIALVTVVVVLLAVIAFFFYGSRWMKKV